MKVSYPWLLKFVDLDSLAIDVEVIAETLTMIGLNVEEILQQEGDYAFDLEVTTNRPDCLNHLGVSRELATQFALPLNSVDFSEPENVNPESPVLDSSVTIEDSELCPRYAARVITGIKVDESPDWLKSRLESVGQRPINNIVDITNFVMFDIGHPLHAFDYEKLSENRIVVRRARPGETLVTLDGLKRELDPAMLLICDAKEPVALAGIMGGEDSEVSPNTQSILLESAYFDIGTVRKTAKELGLRTEASFRFERGADPELPVRALNRACRLIQEVTGGIFAGPVIDQYPNVKNRDTIELHSERIRQIMGVSVDNKFVEDTLTRLEFNALEFGNGRWKFEVPNFRVDVTLEDDLVEEVARHYGYNRIEATYPPATNIGSFLITDQHERSLIQTLQRFGFLEAMNYAFTSPTSERTFWGEILPMVPLVNPLTEVGTHLRISLLPGLIETLRHNLHHGNKDVRLFEFGKVFLPAESEKGNGIQESSRLGFLATGQFYEPFWNVSQDSFHFHHVKGIVQELLAPFVCPVEFETEPETDFLHPGMAARVSNHGKVLGTVGQLHPRVHQAYKFLQPVFVGEVLLEPVYKTPISEPIYQSLGRFPSVKRDLSFVIDKQVKYDKIDSALKDLELPDLQSIQLVDLYQGPTLPKGKVSLAVRLTFVSPEKTLTQEEVNRYMEQVFSVLTSKFSVQVRS